MTGISKVTKRQLGSSDLKCAPVGLGCMSLSGAYGAADDEENVKFVRYAIDQGIDFLDSSDMYGWGHNEEVLARALADGYRDKVVLASKFGQVQLEGGGMGVNGRPEYVPEACDASLKRLGVDVIDLYFQHRVDQDVPIEDTVGAMAKLIEGKTTLLIAHRFSSLKLAQRILVMDEGRIIADGSHEDLHRECDLYRKLYDSQFGTSPGGAD